MTTTETAELLNVTPRRVQALIKTGQLKATKKGRDWDVSRASAIRYKETRKTGRPYAPKLVELTP